MIKGIVGSKVKVIGKQDNADQFFLDNNKEYTVSHFTTGKFNINDNEEWHPAVSLKEISADVFFIASIFEDV